MPGSKRRREPFHAKDARRRLQHAALVGNGINTFSQGCHKLSRLIRCSSLLSNVDDTFENVIETRWREPDDMRRVWKHFEHARNFIARRRTYLTQVLREDNIRRQLTQHILVDLIETLPVFETLADGGINFRWM